MESRIFEVPKYVSPKADLVLPIKSIGFDSGLNKSGDKVGGHIPPEGKRVRKPKKK